jgi:hypothetical protein
MQRKIPLTIAATASLLFCAAAGAALTSFTDQPAWHAAAGGAGQVTVLHFDGPTETHGTAVNDSSIVPSYSSQGVDFLPFTGTSVFPFVARGQGHQISDPNRDGLIANNSTPNPETDLDGRAIRFNFNTPVRSVGTYFNGPLNDGDLGFLRIYDTSFAVIGTSPLSAAGGFIGVQSDQLIGRVDVVNTFNEDILFGIWDLQFSAVPEPGCLAWLSVAAVLLRRRKNAMIRG